MSECLEPSAMGSSVGLLKREGGASRLSQPFLQIPKGTFSHSDSHVPLKLDATEVSSSWPPIYTQKSAVIYTSDIEEH